MKNFGSNNLHGVVYLCLLKTKSCCGDRDSLEFSVILLSMAMITGICHYTQLWSYSYLNYINYNSVDLTTKESLLLKY